MGVIDYFGPIWTNIPHVTPTERPGKSTLDMDYYRYTYCSPEEVAHIRKTEK